MAPRNIAIQLRAWRQRRGMTEAKAAGELGVPVAAYVAWEEGKPCRWASLVENHIGIPVAPVIKGRRQ